MTYFPGPCCVKVGLFCWLSEYLLVFLLTVTWLQSGGGLSKAGVSPTAHPGARSSAGDAQEVPGGGVCPVQLRGGGGGDCLDLPVSPLRLRTALCLHLWYQTQPLSKSSACLGVQIFFLFKNTVFLLLITKLQERQFSFLFVLFLWFCNFLV